MKTLKDFVTDMNPSISAVKENSAGYRFYAKNELLERPRIEERENNVAKEAFDNMMEVEKWKF